MAAPAVPGLGKGCPGFCSSKAAETRLKKTVATEGAEEGKWLVNKQTQTLRQDWPRLATKVRQLTLRTTVVHLVTSSARGASSLAAVRHKVQTSTRGTQHHISSPLHYGCGPLIWTEDVLKGCEGGRLALLTTTAAKHRLFLFLIWHTLTLMPNASARYTAVPCWSAERRRVYTSRTQHRV